MAKKRRPKPQKPRRSKKYNPRKHGDDDYQGASGFMQGITRGLRAVVGTDSAEVEDQGPATTPPWVVALWWVLILGGGGYFVYQWLQ